jgi:hypothetical protein
VSYDATGLAPGAYESTLCVESNAANTPLVQVPVSLTVTGEGGNQAPDCSAAKPSRALLWPPDNEFKSIGVRGVTDPDGDSVSIVIDSIFQDEPVTGPGSGHTSPDGAGVGTARAKVRAERNSGGNGRVYHISFTATDANGASCMGEVLVGVPTRRNGRPPIDDGAIYDSTQP